MWSAENLCIAPRKLVRASAYIALKITLPAHRVHHLPANHHSFSYHPCRLVFVLASLQIAYKLCQCELREPNNIKRNDGCSKPRKYIYTLYTYIGLHKATKLRVSGKPLFQSFHPLTPHTRTMHTNIFPFFFQ